MQTSARNRSCSTKIKKKFKFFNKKYIKEMQYISLITTTKLNNIYTMFYYIS